MRRGRWFGAVGPARAVREGVERRLTALFPAQAAHRITMTVPLPLIPLAGKEVAGFRVPVNVPYP